MQQTINKIKIMRRAYLLTVHIKRLPIRLKGCWSLEIAVKKFNEQLTIL